MFCFLIVGEFSLLTIGVDSRCFKSSSPELTVPTATDSIFQGEVLQRAIQYNRVEASLAMSGFDSFHLTCCLGSLLTMLSKKGGTTRWCSQDRCGPAPDRQKTSTSAEGWLTFVWLEILRSLIPIRVSGRDRRLLSIQGGARQADYFPPLYAVTLEGTQEGKQSIMRRGEQSQNRI